MFPSTATIPQLLTHFHSTGLGWRGASESREPAESLRPAEVVESCLCKTGHAQRVTGSRGDHGDSRAAAALCSALSSPRSRSISETVY